MRLTFAAQSTPRNHPFTYPQDRHPAGMVKKRAATLPWPRLN